MRRCARRAAAIGLAGLVLAGGCATPSQTARVRVERPADLPAAAELQDVPFFPQERYQCGPAALATVLADLGRGVEPAELVDAVYVPDRQGSLRTEMRAAARARATLPYPLEPRLEALLRELAAGRPVLVMQNLGLDWWPRWHYAVAVGYDLRDEVIVLRSGTQRRRVTDLATFERTWARADRWAQVVVRPGDPPATAEGIPWLRSVRELEATGGASAAAPGYRVATERWPRLQPAWLARGNTAWARGRPGRARAAFRRAVEVKPAEASGWNNYAHALAATGCGNAALRAARCAIGLAPDDPDARDTLEALTAEPQPQGPSTSCDIPACPAAADR